MMESNRNSRWTTLLATLAILVVLQSLNTFALYALKNPSSFPLVCAGVPGWLFFSFHATSWATINITLVGHVAFVVKCILGNRSPRAYVAIAGLVVAVAVLCQIPTIVNDCVFFRGPRISENATIAIFFIAIDIILSVMVLFAISPFISFGLAGSGSRDHQAAQSTSNTWTIYGLMSVTTTIACSLAIWRIVDWRGYYDHWHLLCMFLVSCHGVSIAWLALYLCEESRKIIVISVVFFLASLVFWVLNLTILYVHKPWLNSGNYSSMIGRQTIVILAVLATHLWLLRCWKEFGYRPEISFRRVSLLLPKTESQG